MWIRSQKLRYLFVFFALSVTWSVQVRAQTVRFVQMTDPHLFDKGEETENKTALTSCIRKLNQQSVEEGEFDFAVVTGDIGIENLVSIGKDTNGASILETDRARREGRIEQGAAELASILSQSKIRVWLFLPGNNDLLNEEPDLQYYRLFIQKLKDKLSGMEIVDLCPEEPSDNTQQLGVYRRGAFAFVGFNNASFKNDNKFDRIGRNKVKQLGYIQQVVNRIAPKEISAAYIFYHIPELDDPYLALGSDSKTLDERKKYATNPYPYSSWFVDKDVHELWKDQVVKQPKVRGLFAGHYHDWKRDSYTSYHWMKTDSYLSGSLTKLYISPPIAVKRQSDASSQARGFQEVTIDGIGGVVAKVFWYSSADQTFDGNGDKEEREALKQLGLGEIYENGDQLKEANDAYTKALTSTSPLTRRRAYDGIGRVTHMQMSFWNKYIFTRIGRSLSFTESWLLTAFIAFALILIVWLLILRRRKNRLGLELFVDSTENKQAAGFQEILKVRLEGLRKVKRGGVQDHSLGPLPLYTATKTKAPALINVPILWESSVFVDLAAKSLPGVYGAFAASFLQRFDKPEYLINGVFQSDGADRVYVIVTLKRRGRLLRVWEQVLTAPGLVDQQGDLATGILIFLREYLINEHAN